MRNHSPAHLEVLLYGCCSNTSSAENVNVREEKWWDWVGVREAQPCPSLLFISVTRDIHYPILSLPWDYLFLQGKACCSFSFWMVVLIQCNIPGKYTQLLLLYPSLKKKNSKKPPPKPPCGYKNVIYKNILRIDNSKQPLSYYLLFCLLQNNDWKFFFLQELCWRLPCPGCWWDLEDKLLHRTLCHARQVSWVQASFRAPSQPACFAQWLLCSWKHSWNAEAGRMLLRRGASPNSWAVSKCCWALGGLQGWVAKMALVSLWKCCCDTALLFRALQRPEFCMHLVFPRQFSESEQTTHVLLPKSSQQLELGRAAPVLRHSQKLYLQTDMGKLWLQGCKLSTGFETVPL